MSDETRRSAVGYAIAVDVVIVATGVGLLFASVPPVLLVAYVAAVGVAAFKGRWSAAIVAFALSVVALLVLFREAFDAWWFAAFAASAAVVSAILASARPAHRSKTEVVPDAGPAANVIAFDRPGAIEAEERRRESLQRQEIAKALQRAAAEQLERQKHAKHAVAAPVAAAGGRAPRLLLLERRRRAADAVAPKLKERGVDVAIVQRWSDAAGEIERFDPDALLVDNELSDFDRICTTLAAEHATLALFVTGRPESRSDGRNFVARPYDADALAQLARAAMSGERTANRAQ